MLTLVPSGQRTTPPPRLLVDMVETAMAPKPRWAAHVRATGVTEPLWHPGQVLFVGRYTAVVDLVDEITRIRDGLRVYWPQLEVRYFLEGSPAKAHAMARRHAMRLPT